MRRNPWLATVLVLAALVVVSAVAAAVAGGETATHGFTHVGAAAVILAALGSVVARRPPARTTTRTVATAITVLAAGQVAESVGAHGWDSRQLLEQRGALVALHDVGVGAPVLAALIAVAGTALAAVRERRPRRDATRTS